MTKNKKTKNNLAELTITYPGNTKDFDLLKDSSSFEFPDGTTTTIDGVTTTTTNGTWLGSELGAGGAGGSSTEGITNIPYISYDPFSAVLEKLNAIEQRLKEIEDLPIINLLKEGARNDDEDVDKNDK